MKKTWIFLFVVFIFQIFLVSGCANSTSEPKEAVKTEETKDNKSDDTGSKTEPVNPGTPTKEPATTDPATPAEPEPAPVIKYTISFFANSENATGSTESITAESDSTITLTANRFSLTGFKFVGWNTAADGSGTGFSDEASFKLISNLTLYAQWLSTEVPTYSLEIVPPEHGTVELNRYTSRVGKNIRIFIAPDDLYDINTISITMADGTSIIPINNNEIVENKNVYSFTMPEQNVTIQVSFKYTAHAIRIGSSQNCIVTTSVTDAKAGSNVTVMITPSQYYEFETISIRETEYNNEIEVTGSENIYTFTMPEKNVMVYVYCKLVSYQVSFITDSTTVIPNQQVQRNNKVASVTLENTTNREGFLGWYKNSECTEDNKFDFNTPITEDVVLYAKWKTFIIDKRNVHYTMQYSCTVKYVGEKCDYYNANAYLQELYSERKNVYITLDYSEIYSPEGYWPMFFTDCKNLVNIILPEGLEYIEECYFSGCTSLTDVTIPNTVTIIKGEAFENCTSLKNVTFSDNITTIEMCAFLNCSSLLDINIPNKLNTIGYCAFKNCTSLQNITFSNNLKLIDTYAFYGCSSLTNIIIPENVESISSEAFKGCSSLTDLTIKAKRLDCGRNAFKECNNLNNIYISEGVEVLPCGIYSGRSDITTVSIPNSVTKIATQAFEGCTSLINIIIPNNVTDIGDYAFSGCSSLTNITIPNKVKIIGREVFAGCISFTNITIPRSITVIGRSAFDNCTKLANVTFEDTGCRWKLNKYSGSGESIFEIGNMSSNTTSNARALTNTYKDCRWEKIQ